MAHSRRDPSNARIVFGQNLRRVRYEREWTLEDLAEKADMNWSYIAQIERGERNVSIDNMAVLADALGIPLRELL